MKNLICLILIFFIISCEKETEGNPELPPVIKTITQYRYSAKKVDDNVVIDKFLEKDVYNYDESENLVEIISYDKDEKLTGRTVFEYDSTNKMITGYEFDENGKNTFKYGANYNEKSQMIEWLVYYANGTLMSNSYYKYGDGKNITEHIFMEGSVERKSTYKYDIRNNIIEEKDFVNDELISSCTYSYDEYDLNENWINAVEYTWYSYDDSNYLRIIQREIEYYSTLIRAYKVEKSLTNSILHFPR